VSNDWANERLSPQEETTAAFSGSPACTATLPPPTPQQKQRKTLCGRVGSHTKPASSQAVPAAANPAEPPRGVTLVPVVSGIVPSASLHRQAQLMPRLRWRCAFRESDQATEPHQEAAAPRHKHGRRSRQRGPRERD
jgi:hypothetical protein